MRIRSLFGIAVGSMIVVSAARADVQSQTLTIGPRTASFQSSFVFDKFDTSLGTLTGVDFTLAGSVAGTPGFENTSSGVANNIALTLRANLDLTRPDGSLLATTTPQTTIQAGSVAAFDGTQDFGGISGRSYTVASTTPVVDVRSTTATADLSLFSGLGTIALPISSIGSSFATGPGNLDVHFATTSTATVTVNYRFAAGQTVPEPSSLALVACGGAGVVALVWRRRGG